MAEFDLIIRQGRIVDGTGIPSFIGDLAIQDGKVVQVEGLRSATARRELDAEGLIVAPGFIDLHTHYDAQVFWDPYCTVSGWNGVTSVVVGNCGFGFAPVRPEDRERAMLSMTRNEAISLDAMKLMMPWDWVTFPEFLDSLQRTPKGVNMISFAPLSPLIAWVMGLEAAKTRSPTRAEVAEMKRLLHEAMDAGACGFSLQKLGEDSLQRDYDGTPMVTDVMSDELILEFGSVLAERDAGFVQITYAPFSSKTDVLEGLTSDVTAKFVEELARVSGRPILHNVIIASPFSPDLHRGATAWLGDANDRGLRIWGQSDHCRFWFEFTYDHFNLWDTAPAWRRCFVGSETEKLANLADCSLREEMKAEESALQIQTTGTRIEEIILVDTGGTTTLEGYLGRSMGEIARAEGRHYIDVMLDIARDSRLKAEFRSGQAKGDLNPVYVAEMLRCPYTLPGISDGGAHTKLLVGGVYPTDMLRWLVREEKLFTLEEAHQILSARPARAAGFKDRGFIAEGAPADLVVYDLETLRPDPDWAFERDDLPGGDWRRIQRAVGYRWTIVNGEITFEDGKCTEATPGKLLRHGRG